MKKDMDKHILQILNAEKRSTNPSKKPEDEIRCSRGVSSFCYTGDIHHATHSQNLVSSSNK